MFPAFKFIKHTLLLFCLLFACAAAQASPAILVTGDSLSAAYGIPLQQGWVALMQERLKAEGYPHTVVNTSVSGETTAGGLARLDEELQRYQPDIVVIELGANDGLRGLSLDKMKGNLLNMIRLSHQTGCKVLLLGMRLPTNYGETYTKGFQQVFHEAAEETGVALVPFFLVEIALDKSKFQEDGIHPTAEAQPVLLETVWTRLEPLLKMKAKPGAASETKP